jgi:hypothetical protein
MYDPGMCTPKITVVQLSPGSDLGAPRVPLTERQRAGLACLVCGTDDQLDRYATRVGFVDSSPVFIHSYCRNAWQRGEYRQP